MAAKTNMRKAFTLIELLVVITIIAVLASVFVGKYGQIRENGWSTRCKGNLRSLYQAALNYSNDNSVGAYPPAGSYEVYDPLNAKWYERRAWVTWTGPGIWPNSVPQDNPKGRMVQPTWRGSLGRVSITNGALWEYIGKDMGSYLCPKFRYLARAAGNTDVVRSYAMNAYFGCSDGHAPASYARWSLLTVQTVAYEASRTVLFADMQSSRYYVDGKTVVCTTWAGNDTAGNDSVLDGCNAPAGPPYATYESIGYLHRMGGEYRGHAVFLDGHIEAVGLVNPSSGALSNRTYDACNGIY